MSRPLTSAILMSDSERTTLYDDITAWHKANDALAIAKENEKLLRENLAKKYFASAKEGTSTITLEYGKALKCTKTVNRKVDEAQLEAIVTLARSTGNSIVIAKHDELFRYKPSLNVGEWKEDDAGRMLFADAVTESDGTPQIKIETPKR